MVKIIALMKKRNGMSKDEFIDYYENHHAPLACALLPMPEYYRRNYTKKMRFNFKEVADDFEYDCVTEMRFAEEADYLAFSESVRKPEILMQIAADEARFLDRSATRVMVVEEHSNQ